MPMQIIRKLQWIKILRFFNSGLEVKLVVFVVVKFIQVGEDVNRPEKRDKYLKFSEKEKFVLAKHASEHSVTKAVWYFQSNNVKESSVRDWKRIYEKELEDKCKNATPGKIIEITSEGILLCC